MKSGKSQVKVRTARSMNASRSSGGESAEDFTSKDASSKGMCRSTPPFSARTKTEVPLTETVPRSTRIKQGNLGLKQATLIGNESLSHADMIPNASESEIFIFGILAHDLGVPMAIDLLETAREMHAEGLRSRV